MEQVKRWGRWGSVFSMTQNRFKQEAVSGPANQWHFVQNHVWLEPISDLSSGLTP